MKDNMPTAAAARLARRDVLLGAAAAGLGLAAPGAWAQGATWPSKPVNLVVPFPAGGGTDAFARPLAAQFSKALGKTLVIENRGGAGGTVGASHAAKAAPDGYTLFMGAVHHTIAPSMYPKLDYDIEKDFIPLYLLANVPQVVVVNPKAVPVNSYQQFMDYVKRNPPSSTTARRARAPRTTWRASCSSSRPIPSSPTSPTVARAPRCRT